MHRPPSDRVGTYPLQEFFDRHAADPRPWSIDDMLPDYVLADRAIPQWPRAWMPVVVSFSGFENGLQEALASIPLPEPRTPWEPHHHINPDPPPWMRVHDHDHTEECGVSCPSFGMPRSVRITSCDVDRPRPNISPSRQYLVLLLLITAAAIAAWIILGVTA